MNAAAVHPFPFATEFGWSPGPRPDAVDLQIEIAELRRELARAREEGREEGARQALAELRAERDSALLAATEAVQAALATLEACFEETERNVAKLGAELALDFADHLAACHLQRDPAAAIDVAIGRALSEVRRGQPIRVRIHPSLAALIESCIAVRQAEDRRRLAIAVIGDEALKLGDAHIDWDGGALLLDRDARLKALRAEIAVLDAA